MTLTVGSLFSGIGGLDLGLERAGMVCRFQCEIDPFCVRVLAKHWPDVLRYGDLREVDWYEVEPVDLVCGGFPCQPVSLAGRGRAQSDERWLWPEFARCLRVVRPRFVVVENVPGLLGRGMGVVLADLSACGYDAEWDSVPAAFVGAPHNRDRVFIVAYPHCDGRVSPPVFAGIAASAVAAQPMAGFSAWRQRGRLRQSLGGRIRLLPDGGTNRVGDGVSTALDELRVKALGNAVVPQVAELIGRAILAVEAGRHAN